MIIQTIIEILKTEDSVFINDLGQFTKCFVSAQLKDGLLYPPQNKVKFNHRSDGNGFAFILKLSEKFQKRIPEADTEVKNWVEELKSAVENNKSVAFDNFGTFFINVKGKLGFESAFIIELNSEYEGMEPIEVKSVEKEVHPEATPSVQEIKEKITETTSENFKPAPSPTPVSDIPEVTNISVVCETSEVIEIAEPIIETIPAEPVKEETILENKAKTETVISDEIITEEKELPPKKKSHKATIILTIILLILLALGAFCYFYWVPIELTLKDIMHKYIDKEQVLTDEAPRSASEYQILGQVTENGNCKESTILPPFILGYQQKSDNLQDYTDTVTAGETISKQEPPITSPSSTEYPKTDFQKGKYYVIAGSFISENDAALHIKERALQHLNPLLLYQEGSNRIRVCIGIYDNESEANAYARKFNSNYWVLK
jgi:hypothetical protein